MALPEAPHASPAEAVLAFLGVSASEGLPEHEASARRQRFGANAIAARRAASAWHLLLHQCMSPVIYLLGAAAALALYAREVEEGVAILAVLAINAGIGFLTELRAARSMEALRALGGHGARVRRGGTVRLVPAEALVPGDIVLLDAGDMVPADLRLVEAAQLAADESTLTGESFPVRKDTPPVPGNARIADRASILFKGTAITRGSGVGAVVATGLATELGRVTGLMLDADAGSSPLERRLARLSAQLVWMTLAVAVAITAIGLATGRDAFAIVELAIALAVAAIPEGLPIVATLALARGMWRMARRNALVERLSAVETLGGTTVILTDKTGTLTENRMTVCRLAVPAGEIEPDRAEARAMLRVAALCNDAHLDPAGDIGNGDPMEVALLRAALLAGLDRVELLRQHPIAVTHPFDAGMRMMATVHADGDGFLVAVKGAPEAMLAAATHEASGGGDVALGESSRAAWLARAGNLARDGLRVLACGVKRAARADVAPYEGLVLLGLIGMEDPPRADVPGAIRDCRRAGIRVVMLTGDHAATARGIGRAVGLLDGTGTVREGTDVAGLIAAGPAALRDVAIFARVTPAEKLALVRAYQAAGEVVAMTGDGVNDAPALRQADIGVAMGLRGTDVAREAAAMVLLDDAFPTIVNAIRQGRIIFGNIRRFVAYLLSCNLSEVMVVGLAVLSAIPLPLLPLQILYLNLVTDVFPAFALAMGEGEEGVLERPPRDPREPIVGRAQWLMVALQGAMLGAGTFASLAAAHWLGLHAGQTVTIAFLTLAFAQLWHVFDMRGAGEGLLANDVTRNRWVWAALALCAALLAVPPYVAQTAQLLQLEPPTAPMWGIVLTCSLAPLLVTQAAMELARLRRERRR